MSVPSGPGQVVRKDIRTSSCLVHPSSLTPYTSRTRRVEQCSLAEGAKQEVLCHWQPLVPGPQKQDHDTLACWDAVRGMYLLLLLLQEPRFLRAGKFPTLSQHISIPVVGLFVFFFWKSFPVYTELKSIPILVLVFPFRATKCKIFLLLHSRPPDIWEQPVEVPSVFSSLGSFSSPSNHFLRVTFSCLNGSFWIPPKQSKASDSVLPRTGPDSGQGRVRENHFLVFLHF